MGLGRGWVKALAVAVLLMGAGRVGFTQTSGSPASGILSGRLTDLYSKPLAGVALVAHNQATGSEARTITTKNGSYRFTQLEPGEYTLKAESPLLGRGQLEDIQVDAGYESRVQSAMAFQPLESSPVLTAASGNELPKIENRPQLLVRPKVQPSVNQPNLQPAMPTPALSASAPAVSPTNNSAVAKANPVAALAPAATATNPEPPPPAPPASAPSAPGAQPPQPPVLAASRQSDPSDPAATTTISAEELQSLPVSGRRWQDFVLDNAPTSATPPGGQGQISLRGDGQPTEIAVDGVGKGLAFGRTSGSGRHSSGQGASGEGGNEPAGMALVGSGGHGLALNESAIRSVQTAANAVQAAESHAAGGRMNVETERGSNQLHGQVRFIDRQNNWGARNPFTQWTKETAPATLTSPPVFTSEPYTPPDHETTWGIGAGSRIRRNKLFWFAAFDAIQRNNSGLAMVKHPDQFFAQPKNDQMQVLSARLGLSSTNPVAEGLAAYSKLLESLGGLLGPSARSARQWTGFARLDWEATERNRFTLEGVGALWDAPGGGLTRASETYGSHSFGSTKASEEWLLGRWEAFLTPNLLAVTQVSAGRTVQQARPQTPSAFEQSFLTGNAWGQLPQIVVDSRYGFTIGNPSRFGTGSYPDERAFKLNESVAWVHGKLLVRTGFDLSHSADATTLLRNQTGTYHYTSIENFASDALVFAKFGLTNALNPFDQHNCDQTGRVWRDSTGTLRGLGYLPCYSYYTQSIGPANWHLSTNDWAGYATAQWQATKQVVLSAGLRWELEQLPPPLAALKNPKLPLTERLPALGNNWGPRISLTMGTGERRWPVLRLGYGMYFGRTENAAVETALTQTGSLKGDLDFFMRPTDNLNAGGAPPFPYVLAGEPPSAIKPGAVEFAPNFRNREVHQALLSVEEKLPGHNLVTANAMVSLGRRLPISIDTNFDPAVNPGSITYAVEDTTGVGPIKAQQITVPFYASWPSTNSSTGFGGRLNPEYQQVTEIASRANSTYEAATLRLLHHGPRGLSLSAHYTYSHAMDWNPNESTRVAGNDVLDPADFKHEYGTSNLDVRHSGGGTATYLPPWKLHGLAGPFLNGWLLSGIGQARGGRPYTMRTSGSLAQLFDESGASIVGLAPGMNGSGGDNRVYGLGSDHRTYDIGRNTFRYPATWKIDLRVSKRFDLGHKRQLELLTESFNLLNHQNVTELETTGYYLGPGSPSGALPTLTFLTGLKANSTAFGQPLNINATNFYRERQFQLGLKLKF